MLSNYFRFALRQIKKNKVYSLLNILGLSIGLASFFVIYLFINNELGYDKHHENGDRIYRVVRTSQSTEGAEKRSGLTAALAPEATNLIPQIQTYSRVGSRNREVSLMEKPDSTFTVWATSVDLGFNQMFDLDYIIGSRESSFQSGNSAVIIESSARRIFGSVEQAINQEFKIGKSAFRIDGVVRDPPITSSLKYALLLPFKTAEKVRGSRIKNWYVNLNDESYFLLREGASSLEIEQEVNKLFNNRTDYGNQAPIFWLQPLEDVHFSLDVQDDVIGKSDRQYIMIFWLVAIFILACAVFNYISLTLSQLIPRVKEMGVRKVMGANARQLLGQYIFESALYVMIATVVSIILVEFTIPVLEAFLDRSTQSGFIENPELILRGFVFALIIAIVSSLYPAYVCLRLHAVSMLKGKGYSLFSSQKLISAISVFQIVVFLTLICSAFVARKQMAFMQKENLGFDNESILVLPLVAEHLIERTDVLKNELSGLPSVERISFANAIPTSWISTVFFTEYDFGFHNFDVDEQYIETIGMKLVAGRNFLPSDPDSISNIMINETSATKLKIADDPLGKKVNGSTIIGVVSDFHFISKKQPIEAVMFRRIKSGTRGNLILKLKSEDLKATMASVQSVFESITDQANMDYFFMDDKFNEQYKHETLMTSMIDSFTFLAALVAFIGLFGTAGYNVSQRMKEMGIRKVLGAGFLDIQRKLNQPNFYKLLIAILVAVPLTIYLMGNWLDSFAYRIEIPFWLIFVAIVPAIVVVLIAVSVHSIRAYFINPVLILKDE